MAWRRLAVYFSMRSGMVPQRSAWGGGSGTVAVAIVELTDVEHGFWVVLGTLSVLRSNALGTGSTALRAVGGTTVGVVFGSAIMIGVGGHSVLLWALLPVAVLVSGIAPSMISFAAGQAGFQCRRHHPLQHHRSDGLEGGPDKGRRCRHRLRREPRRGIALLAHEEPLQRSATPSLMPLRRTQGYRRRSGPPDHDERNHRHASGPSARLIGRISGSMTPSVSSWPNAGAKVVPVETVADLFTGANRIRLAAHTLSTLDMLAPDPGQPELESVSIAGAVLRDSYASSHHWYGEFAELLADHRDRLDPPPVHDDTLHAVLRAAFDDARARKRGDRLRTILRMLLGRPATREPASGPDGPGTLGRPLRPAPASRCADLTTIERATPGCSLRWTSTAGVGHVKRCSQRAFPRNILTTENGMTFTCDGFGVVMVTGDPYPAKSTVPVSPTAPFVAVPVTVTVV